MQSYILYTEAHKFVLPVPGINETPNSHNLCGSLTYLVLFDGTEIDQTSAPLSFQSINREFSIFTDDAADIGVHEVSVTAHLTDYPDTESPELKVNIEVIDACPNPFSVVAPD